MIIKIILWVIALGLLISTIVLLLPKKEKNSSDDENENKKDSKFTKLLKDNWPVLVALVACHLLLFYKIPNWYSLFAHNPVFWIAQIGFWFVYAFLRKDVGTKDKPRKEHTPIGILTLVILSVISLYSIYEWNANLPSKKSARVNTSAVPNTPWKPVLLPQGQSEGKNLAEVREFWKKHLSEAEVEEMVIICRNESGGCNQFDASSKVMTNTNTNGTHDIGAMQINDEWWKKEVEQEKSRGNKDIESYDPKTLEGNLKLALHYRQKYGLGPWSLGSREATKTASVIVIAPTEDWSEIVDTPRGFNFSYDKENSPVKLRLLPSGQELMGDNRSGLRFEQPQAIRFKSMGTSPVTVFLFFK